MKAIKFLGIALLALTIVSCSKTKEEEFVEDYEEFVEKCESTSREGLKAQFYQMDNKEGWMYQFLVEKFVKYYGIDDTEDNAVAIFKGRMMDVVNTTELKLNDDQKAKVIELGERLNTLITKLNEEEAEASNTSDAAEDVKTEPSPSYLASLQPEDILLPAQLKGKVEVLNGDDDCIPVELDNNNYPEITITFKLLGKVNTASLASASGQLWIVGEAQDNAGRAVKDILPSYGEWRTDDSDGSEFKAFLESEPDETITLSFTGESNIELFEKDQSKIDAGIAKTTAACKKVGKFKLKITN